MTDTVFYDDLFNLATELMNDFGTPATLRKLTGNTIGADGKATPTYNDTPGLAVRISDQEMLTSLNLKGELVFAGKFPATGVAMDLIVHGGETWVVESSKLINPEGSRLMLGFYGATRA